MGNFKKAMLTNLPLPYDIICMGNPISGQYQIKREIIKYEGHFPWLQNFELHEGVFPATGHTASTGAALGQLRHHADEWL